VRHDRPTRHGPQRLPSDDGAFAAGSIAHAVLEIADQLQLDRFVIWGVSAGAAPSLIVAAEHPERVHALIVSGAWPADWRLWRDYLLDLAALMRRQGGRMALETIFAEESISMPDWARSTDPDGEAVARIIEGTLDYDWSTRAMPTMIRPPTLIIVGALEDPDCEAQGVAAAMDDAEAVYLPARGHVGAWLEEVEENVAHVRRFVRARLE
jgi:pimeloyl-ACP methyl ester carboxylesterase